MDDNPDTHNPHDKFLVIVHCEIFDVKHSTINKMCNKQKSLYGLCVCGEIIHEL